MKKRSLIIVTVAMAVIVFISFDLGRRFGKKQEEKQEKQIEIEEDLNEFDEVLGL